MSAKRYKAADMRRALQMVREDLGADAVILSSARTATGFEVVACADGEWRKVSGEERQSPTHDEAPAQRETSVRHETAVALENMLESGAVTPVAVVQSTLANDVSNEVLRAAVRRELRQELQHELGGEIRELRDWLQTQWQQNPVVPVGDVRFAALRQRLECLGLPTTLHARALSLAPEHGDEKLRWRALMNGLAARLACLPMDQRLSHDCLALVGPSGAGKTTTLQKLAVRHALRYGREQVGIVSLDAERIGAHQALSVFCHMLDVPLKMAQDRDSLDLALRSLRNRSLVLIDIPGSHMGSASQQSIFRLLQAFPVIRTYLALPCTVQYPVMNAWWQGARVLSPGGLVLTKIDEAASLGEALGICLHSGLPLAWLTNGPRVPDDLQEPDAQRLLARAVELARSGEPAATLRGAASLA